MHYAKPIPILFVLLLVGAVVLVPGGRFPLVAAHDACPPGQTPLQNVTLADVMLNAGAPPYSRTILSQITLMPGETLDTPPTGYTAYYVESGSLEYTVRAGLAITRSPKCRSQDGYITMGGSMSIAADGMGTVNKGESLVSDEIPTGPLRNGGVTPLVTLQMTMLPPEIDPDSGLPIVDSVMAARFAERERERQKQACRAAQLGTPIVDAEPRAPFSTGGWESDAPDRAPKIPKACRS